MDRQELQILVVTHRPLELLFPKLILEEAVISSASDESGAAAQLGTRYFDVIFVDFAVDGAESILAHLAKLAPDAGFVAVGEDDSSSTSLAALRAGASGYLPIPIQAAEFEQALEAALGVSTDDAASTSNVGGSRLLGQSAPMMAVNEAIRRAAAGSSTVLVRGESGTGKELVARALHEQSARSQGPFLKVHAPSVPDALLESELFGHEKGAFTGAATRKPGRVELAAGGTLFLDEVAEMSQVMQAKLLRLIQDREFERLGGTRTLRADLRFVAATHRDMEHMVESGTFREDLFYRLNVVVIWLPPLRARREDIPLLVNHYFGHFRELSARPGLVIDQTAVDFLTQQRWPGNVRQLVNLVERLVVMANREQVGIDEVRREFQVQTAFVTQSVPQDLSDTKPDDRIPNATLDSAVRPLREEIRRAERRALEKALESARGNRALAARLLGISRRTMYTKLDEHGIR